MKLTGETIRRSIAAACSLNNPRLSEVEWEVVASDLRTALAHDRPSGSVPRIDRDRWESNIDYRDGWNDGHRDGLDTAAALAGSSDPEAVGLDAGLLRAIEIVMAQPHFPGHTMRPPNSQRWISRGETIAALRAAVLSGSEATAADDAEASDPEAVGVDGFTLARVLAGFGYTPHKSPWRAAMDDIAAEYVRLTEAKPETPA